MKQFDFRLGKALDWRAMQARLAESGLEKLQTELRALEEAKARLLAERDRAGRALIASGSATGVELAFLESFKQAAAAELARLEKRRIECRNQLEAQLQVVRERRRDTRVLEQLKDKKLAQWRLDLQRELDEQASETHLTRWNLA
jgi:hypothetical protein